MRALLLAALLLATQLFAAPTLAKDARVGVCLLPTLAQGVSATTAALLDAGLATSLQAQSAFRLEVPTLDLPAKLAEDPACRDLHSCLGPSLPEDAKLVVDPRLAVRGGLLVLDLQLEYQGREVRRHSSAIRSSQLSATLERELPLLLAGWSADARLYARALEGDEQAAQTLRRHFPGSTWLQALEQERAR